MVLLAVAVWPGGARADAPVVVAVHPYLSANELIERFQPLAAQLSSALKRPVQVSVSADYESHVERIAKGDVDIAYIGPAAYVALTKAYGPQTLLARLSIKGAPVFHGYIVVRDDSPIQTLADLKGRRFAFGSPSSTMSYVAPYAMLKEAGIDKSALGHFDFVGSHENVALAVLAGAFDAGGVKEEIYFKYREQGLRMLAKSPPVSEHLFVATKRLSDAEAETARRTLLALSDSGAGRTALMFIKKTVDALDEVHDADYDPLRRMVELAGNGNGNGQ